MSAGLQQDVQLESPHALLEGTLMVPTSATGVVLFAHGSGSSRFSPRNQYVAGVLREAGLATLLMDLLEEWEAEDRTKVFDSEMLAERLLFATGWLEEDLHTAGLPVGYFGASTGAAAALIAAAQDESIKAVVSRGGRPDLAAQYLPEVKAPTLLIVGGSDWPVITFNKEALEMLPGVKELMIVPGATHLFEEKGALEEVARLARDWFVKYLV